MDMMKLFLGLENCRVRFSTGEGDYEGTISRVAPEIQLLVLNKLIWLPKNLNMGTLTFRAKEIEAFSVIGRSETPKIDVCSTYANLYERDCQRPTIFDDELNDNSSDQESQFHSLLESEDKEYIFNLPSFLCDDLPLDNVVIDELSQDFYDAIQHFQKQDVIGLSLESPKIGRYENIDWLCISTVTCTFLFDIKTLGESALNCGLQKILEDSSLEKVVHDCRKVSDCLFHRYSTRILNVFDTQVADFVINQQRKKDGKIIHSVHSLNSCLARYLNVPEEFLFRRKKQSYQDDLVFYNLRPVTDNLRDLFTKNVVYLRQLRKELDILIMEPLDKCVDIYMKSVRSKTDRELQLENFVGNAVPDELLSEGIQIFRFKKHVDIPAVIHSGPPFRELEDSYQEYVNYCKKHGTADLEFFDGELRGLYERNHWCFKNPILVI